MRNLSPAFKTAISSGTTDLTRIWRVTRRDGTVFRFTDLDRDVVFSGDTYLATTSFQMTSITHTASGGAQSINLKLTLGSQITFDDLADGKYNYAAIEIAVIIWSNPSAGKAILFNGNFGNIELSPLRKQAQIEAVGRLEASIQGIGEFYSAECRADLGDARCGVNLALHTTTGVVDSVSSSRKFVSTFVVNPNNFEYSFGKLTWTSGNNLNSVHEVLQQIGTNATQDELLLALNTAKPIQVGDTFSIHKGCDFRPSTCHTRFANIINFRGEPHVPGPDFIEDKQEEL
jgi:uncharacterized phage protein (TIGR02218 family)